MTRTERKKGKRYPWEMTPSQLKRHLASCYRRENPLMEFQHVFLTDFFTEKVEAYLKTKGYKYFTIDLTPLSVCLVVKLRKDDLFKFGIMVQMLSCLPGDN